MKFRDWIKEGKYGSRGFDAAIGKREKQRQKFNAKVSKEVEKLGGHPGKIDWDTVNHMWFSDKDFRETAKSIYQIQKKLGVNIK